MKYKKIKKVTIALTVICIIATVINVSFMYLLPKYIINKIDRASDISSIAIIGAADGPTSILVGSSSSFYLITTILALLSITGIVFLIFIKRKNNKED